MNISDLENLLRSAYQREAACYSRALQAGRELDEALQHSQNPMTALQRLGAALEEVAVIETDIREAKQLWQQLFRQPGPDLQWALNEVASLIREVQTCVGSAEVQARERSGRLAPQVDHITRGWQMRTAYSGIMAAAMNTSLRQGKGP